MKIAKLQVEFKTGGFYQSKRQPDLIIHPYSFRCHSASSFHEECDQQNGTQEK